MTNNLSATTSFFKAEHLEVIKGGHRLLQDITFSMKSGELISILGPSGSGKTTLLNTLMGFEDISQGTVSLQGKVLSSPTVCVDPGQRSFSAVFQNLTLFPHLNVRDNILYGIWSWSAEEKEQRLRELAKLVELSDKLDRHVSTLSGGEKQRVAIARGLAPKPSILFLDEPFSNLDRLLRLEVRRFIKKVLKEAGVSAFLVTHDKEDAFHFSDRLILMDQGRIKQWGTPEELYCRPKDDFVTRFFSSGLSVDGVSVSPHELELCPEDDPHKLFSGEVMDSYFSEGRMKYILKLSSSGRYFDLYNDHKFSVGDTVGLKRKALS